jgi:serine/threonine protein kinase
VDIFWDETIPIEGEEFNNVQLIAEEFAPNGDLKTFLKKKRSHSKLNDDYLWNLFKQISLGVLHLHTQSPPIMHLDLHPGNILVDENEQCMITDFGSSRTTKTVDGQQHQVLMQLAYTAPEILSGQPADLKADIYSFGVVSNSLWQTLICRLCGKLLQG